MAYNAPFCPKCGVESWDTGADYGVTRPTWKARSNTLHYKCTRCKSKWVIPAQDSQLPTVSTLKGSWWSRIKHFFSRNPKLPVARLKE